MTAVPTATEVLIPLELTNRVHGDMHHPRIAVMGRHEAAIAVRRRRTTISNTSTVTMTAAARPCSPRGVPIPIR